MKYTTAYIDASGDVLSLATKSTHTADDVRDSITDRTGTDPGELTKITSPPSGLVGQYAQRKKGLPAYCHQKTSGDGTDISHYIQIEVLEELKAFRIKEINDHTHALIHAGFEYPASSSQIFSMNETAQINLEVATRTKSTLTYPMVYSFIDDSGSVSIADSTEMQNMFNDAFAHKRTQLDSGNTLKQSIRDATTKAAIDAVVDSRT